MLWFLYVNKSMSGPFFGKLKAVVYVQVEIARLIVGQELPVMVQKIHRRQFFPAGPNRHRFASQIG
jgi:hypothetical protein